MQKLYTLFSAFIICIGINAQISSGGQPIEFNTTMLRSSSNLYNKLNVDTTQALQAKGRAMQCGYTAPLNLNPENSGYTFTTENGDNVWRVGIYSNGAKSMSVVFDKFKIPIGAKLFIYNPTQTEVLGAFTSINNNENNELPIQQLYNDSLIVEYIEPNNVSFKGELNIGMAAHNTITLRSVNTFLTAEKCSPHSSTVSRVADIKRAVCFIYTLSNSGAFYGTGTLINNTKGKPYIYSAAHVFVNKDDCRRTIFYFNYEVPAKDSTIQGTEETVMAGAVSRAYAPNLDMTLVELNQTPPKDYRTYYAGWTLNGGPEPEYVCVQHPEGDTKRVSIEKELLTISTYPNADIPNPVQGGWYWVKTWEKGITAGGSSGSALFDKDNRIIGALTGGASYCATPYDDFFARLNVAWNYYSDADMQLAHWLDPDNSGINYMDGQESHSDNNPCDRITNITESDVLSRTHLPSNQGYLVGHNSLNHTQYAEKFTTDDNKLLYGVYVIAAKGRYNVNAPIYVNIYSGDDKPETLLKKALFKPTRPRMYRDSTITTVTKTTFTNKENYIRFDEPVRVGKSFFVGYEIQYDYFTRNDSFSVYNVSNRALNEDNNKTYYFDGSNWNSFVNHSYSPIATSLWVEPIVAFDPTVAVQKTTENKFSVYPNPSTDGIIYINNADDDTNFTLFNIEGKKLQSGKGKKLELPAQSGMYFLVVGEGNYSETLKVIKQ